MLTRGTALDLDDTTGIGFSLMHLLNIGGAWTNIHSSSRYAHLYLLVMSDGRQI